MGARIDCCVRSVLRPRTHAHSFAFFAHPHASCFAACGDSEDEKKDCRGLRGHASREERRSVASLSTYVLPDMQSRRGGDTRFRSFVGAACGRDERQAIFALMSNAGGWVSRGQGSKKL
eukprot:6195285-Pleurochrysis_carterae.AAC.1